MTSTEILYEFETLLSLLKQHPDKKLILDLTKICEHYVNLAEPLSEMIIARIIDPLIPPDWKLPIFYLLDSVMKHVGGPFAALFSRHLGAAVQRTFDEVRSIVLEEGCLSHLLTVCIACFCLFLYCFIVVIALASQLPVKDKDRLDFLLGTWEERQFFASESLNHIRRMVAVRKGVAAPVQRTAPAMARPAPQPAQQQQQQGHPSRGGSPAAMSSSSMSSSRRMPPQQQQQQQQQPAYGKRPREEQSISHRDGRGAHGGSRDRDVMPGRPAMAGVGGRGSPQGDPRSEPRRDPRVGVRGGAGRAPSPMTASQPFRQQPVVQHHQISQQETLEQAARFSKAVEAQMSVLLQQMYKEMGINDPSQAIPLEQLATINPTLFSQMKAAAEVTVAAEFANTAPLDMSDENRTRMLCAATGMGPAAGVNVSAAEGEEDGPLVKAFVGEAPVVVDLDRAKLLLQRLVETQEEAAQYTRTGIKSEFGVPSKGLRDGAQWAEQRLRMLLEGASVPPHVPGILFGPLPLEPSPAYRQAQAQAMADRSSAGHPTQPQQRLLKPRFRTEELLSEGYKRAVHGLYHAQPCQYPHDAIRFRSMAELAKYADMMIVKKAAAEKKTTDDHRQWYCTKTQWITDFGNPSFSGATGAAASSSGSAAAAVSAPTAESTEEFVVPADENFTRCPVSKEAFETVWDGDEGTFMYRNAAKVLVTEAADKDLFKLALPTEEPGVGYLIVHKPLVLDGWLQTGRSATLRQAILRYEAITGSSEQKQRGQELASAIAAAAGDDEDEDDVFVMLELTI